MSLIKSDLLDLRCKDGDTITLLDSPTFPEFNFLVSPGPDQTDLCQIK